MKFYTRVAFLFVAFAAFPLSFSYAEDVSDDKKSEAEVLTLEEARNLIDGLPTAHDVVSGAVPTQSQGFYDIYGRQVSFRESAKELRASLDVRRENFGAPRVEALEGYRDTVTKVYAAETVAYQADVRDAAMEKDEDAEEDKVTISVNASDEAKKSDDMPMDEEEVASADDDAQDEEAPGLIEKPIPSDSDEEGAAKKKVVMPDDAPEFDPADL
ncbi:MAG: hypothetical protein COB14_00520 [Alphaproteobacteria bacterium]|nr:MAG: hypothetical protein COB14_00520 [Alphaproteobacteria bacterium]